MKLHLNTIETFTNALKSIVEENKKLLEKLKGIPDLPIIGGKWTIHKCADGQWKPYCKLLCSNCRQSGPTIELTLSQICDKFNHDAGDDR